MILRKRNNKDKQPQPESVVRESNPTVNNSKLEQEIAAVIFTALYLYDAKMREDENAIITIQKIMKPYSPWSSKIYGLRERPMHIPGLRTKLK